MLSKEVVASGKNWKEFGPMVASSAWYAGFFKAQENGCDLAEAGFCEVFRR
jgi:hypothetical protein